MFAHLQSGVIDDPANVVGQRVGREQMESQVLGAAADRLADLLRISRGEDEDDVIGRLLQRLEQRRLSRPRQHVHLVEDVHLVPPGRAERRPLDQVAHGVDPVVAGGVELVNVVAGALFDGKA